MSIVPHNKHVAFHILFGDNNTQQIANVLNEIWIDPDFELIVKPRKHESKIAEKVAHEVQEAINHLEHLYVVILVRENGERDVKIKLNGTHYVN